MKKLISSLVFLSLIIVLNAQNKTNNTDKKVNNNVTGAGTGQGDIDVINPNIKDTLKKGGFAVKEQGMPTDKPKTTKGNVSVGNPKSESDSAGTGIGSGSGVVNQIKNQEEEMKNMDKELRKEMMNMSEQDSTFETIDETNKNKNTPQGGKGNNPNAANPTKKTPPKGPK